MPFLAEVGSGALALTAALVITIGLILWQTQRQFRQSLGRSRWMEDEPWPSSPAVTPEDLSRWEIRMHELARDLQGQLDTKIALLAELVAQAEHAAQRLQNLVDHVDESSRHQTPDAVTLETSCRPLPCASRQASSDSVDHMLTDVRTPLAENILVCITSTEESSVPENCQKLTTPQQQMRCLVRHESPSELMSFKDDSPTPGDQNALSSVPERHPTFEEGTSRFEVVYELLAAGLSPQEIAARTAQY